jgi:hypothetical protein
MVARLVECSDHDCQYGILTVENVDLKEVQDKIYEIKNRFCNEENYSWCVDDVLENFPKEWEWSFERVVDVLEI